MIVVIGPAKHILQKTPQFVKKHSRELIRHSKSSAVLGTAVAGGYLYKEVKKYVVNAYDSYTIAREYKRIERSKEVRHVAR